MWSIEKTDFSQLNQALYSTTFLAYGGKGQFCSRCLASDHTQDDCAPHPDPMFRGFAKKTRRGEAEERTAITMRRGGTGKARAMHGMMAGVQPPIADLNMCVQGAEGTTRDRCAKGSHPK